MDIDKPEYRDGTIPMDIDDPGCLAHDSSDSDMRLNHSLVNTMGWELEQCFTDNEMDWEYCFTDDEKRQEEPSIIQEV
jgi:hypothetical protein